LATAAVATRRPVIVGVDDAAIIINFFLFFFNQKASLKNTKFSENKKIREMCSKARNRFYVLLARIRQGVF
jgi:hypothetical protein